MPLIKQHNDLLFVPVPAQFIRFIIKGINLCYTNPFRLPDTANKYNEARLLPDGKWEILGTVTADTVDFDCGYIVERYKDSAYKNYMHDTENPESIEYVLFKKESLRSLINSLGMWFVNPWKEPEMKDYEFTGTGIGRTGITFPQQGYDIEKYNEDMAGWQSYENMLVGKVAVLKKVK